MATTRGETIMATTRGETIEATTRGETIEATTRGKTIMRSLLFVLLLLVGGVAALGFYRGWFSFKTTYDPEAGRQGVQFEIDRNKIQPDIGKVREKLGGGDTQAEEKPVGQHP
jgi:hypothetical protein